MDAPDLFGVPFKEHLVEGLAEAVDIEVFQRILGPLVQGGREVTESGLDGTPQSHIGEGLPFEGNGIVKETAQIVDPADPVPSQHHPVGNGRVRSAWPGGDGAFQQDVVQGGCTLQWQDLVPPVRHTLALAEKTVPADVHPVSLVTDGLGNAADLGTRFQDHRRNSSIL